jgi:phosphoadenosine phosphosulfate reductase
VQDKESVAIARVYEAKSKKVAVSFSGGKDSLVVLDLAVRAGIKKAVFCDTTIEFEQTLDYVRQMKDYYSIDIEVVRAPITFFDMVERIQVPSRRLRWCCEVFKFGPVAQYARKERLEAFLTGLRCDESNKRSLYTTEDNNPLVPFKQINPIIDWSSNDVWDYIKRYSLPFNPLYEHFERVGCWCCPFRTQKDWRIIEQLFPEKVSDFEKILERYGQKVGIKDMEEFIKGRGWTRWAPPVRHATAGLMRPCQDASKCTTDYVITCNSPDEASRVSTLLPTLTDDFIVFGSRLRVTVPSQKAKRLSILVEKAAGCIGCGACTSVCTEGALSIMNGRLNLDKERCVHCEDCLNGSLLKGACIIRNYSSRKNSYIMTNEDNSLPKDIEAE